MKKGMLGKTGIEVSELCFGILPMGPLQANLPVPEGAKLIRSAVEQDVNFLDTAEAYQTYPPIRAALEGWDKEIIIASKSAADTYEKMEKAVYDALEALGRSYIDIFHLHAARVEASVFEERQGALQCLKDLRKKGLVRAVGISTHAVEAVERAAQVDDIDVVFPIINQTGLGIIGGSVTDMLSAIAKVHQAGKGIYAMKALGGGHLIGQLKSAFDFVRDIPGIASVAVGMVNAKELEVNLKLFNNVAPGDWLAVDHKINKKLLVASFCKGCGTCLDACPNQALSLHDGKAEVNHQLCLLCGYCNPVCPEFALRLV
ncbi:aldo/keto reductase [Candidatus Formimonas warabiya]|uniref:4Fe-4S ferredoxin-type domain-containing protein n=1 Tax=Formimonas warabiya TaxID=1761012 RepID=A0A3G1KRM2_FORW1|nr:aldo/keto reductase [Candidatus Formimonas warabiya]ATW25133.1 hypothetical protein DCMF_10450 [Candidatus Formimonas warabiya]